MYYKNWMLDWEYAGVRFFFPQWPIEVLQPKKKAFSHRPQYRNRWQNNWNALVVICMSLLLTLLNSNYFLSRWWKFKDFQRVHQQHSWDGWRWLLWQELGLIWGLKFKLLPYLNMTMHHEPFSHKNPSGSTSPIRAAPVTCPRCSHRIQQRQLVT